MRARSAQEDAVRRAARAPRAPAHPLHPLQQTIGNQAVQRLLAARGARPSAGRMLQRDFKSDFEGKASTPAVPGAPAAPGTVRVQTIAGQDGKATWVNAPYEIYSPGEIPKEYHDQIMESGKAYQWRNEGRMDYAAMQRDLERLENARELTVGDMVRFDRKAGAKMNVRIAMAKVGDDFRFVGYDLSRGDEGKDVHSGFVESESGTTGGVGRALFADRLTRALLNRASGMNLEVYMSERTAAFHAEIYAAAGREGAPIEGQRYRLTTAEMARLAVAWNSKLTAAQVSNLNALLAKGENVSAADAEAALLRGAVEELPPGGSGGGGGPGGGPVEGPIISPRAQAKGALLAAGAQAVLAKQISNMQSAEKDKALQRFAELSPAIGRLLDQNFAVTITVEVEIPKTVNIAGVVTQTDPSMIVYFRAMYIDQALPILPQRPAGESEPPAFHAVGEIPDQYASPRREDDPHEFTLDQQIREQMGDPDPTGRDKPVHPTHRVMKRSQTITPKTVLGLQAAKDNQQAAALPPKPQPAVDEASARKLAEAPTRVELLTENIAQYRTAVQVRERLNADPVFRVGGEAMGGGGGSTLTRVIYWSEYDRPRAEKLAELLRAQGLPAARADSGGGSSQTPGYIQINFGRDAER
jgi:hypothetical protein